jgi:CubicO group peptidase (beta-lactamase class C family)
MRFLHRLRAVLMHVPSGVLLALPLSAQTITRLDGSRITVARADSIARAQFTAHRVTGAQVAVVNDGRVVWSAAYGIRQRDPVLPMQRTTTTWAASITKSVFATYVMQLVERGEFQLDVPVAAQLPKPLDQYEPYAEKARLLVRDSAWGRVTPRMLLTHRSGLLNFATMEPDGAMRLHAAPGSRSAYSGEGFNLVQFLIEQQRNAPLQSLMQAALFDPLGMTRTAMVFRPGLEVDIADRFGADEQFLAKTRRSPARGAGSMTSTADDLAAFAIALLDDRILSRETRRRMLSPQIAIRTLHQFAQAADEPPGDEARAVGLAYGIGWGLLTSTRFGPAFFKEGHGDGAQTFLICFERSRRCMVILTNSDNGEFTFKPLLEDILGNDVSPWEWHGYTPAYIERSRRPPSP